MSHLEPTALSASPVPARRTRGIPAVRALVAALALSAVAGAGALTLDASADASSDVAGMKFPGARS